MDNENPGSKRFAALAANLTRQYAEIAGLLDALPAPVEVPGLPAGGDFSGAADALVRARRPLRDMPGISMALRSAVRAALDDWLTVYELGMRAAGAGCQDWRLDLMARVLARTAGDIHRASAMPARGGEE